MNKAEKYYEDNQPPILIGPYESEVVTKENCISLMTDFAEEDAIQFQMWLKRPDVKEYFDGNYPGKFVAQTEESLIHFKYQKFQDYEQS